ncbi:hypothetical protein ACHHYP_06395 [Achlya hypogyna]|uniref:Uncharacterized protein n=1 Tax=Achlya hypogyna TaxID=1202772 RepID=A0A1V9YTZ4_ACHHY|nr:hypothetical protein ACHHYP_06395 [Achlya hypogyna]
MDDEEKYMAGTRHGTHDAPKRRKAPPCLVSKESLILGVGVGFFVRDSLHPGDVVAMPVKPTVQPVRLNLPPQVEVRESLIAGVGLGLFACDDLKPGDIVQVPSSSPESSDEGSDDMGLDAPKDPLPAPESPVTQPIDVQPTASISSPVCNPPVVNERILFTLDDVEQRAKYGLSMISVRESLIAGVGFGAFATEDFVPGDVLGALDDPSSPHARTESWDMIEDQPPFADMFSQEPVPADVPVLGDWTNVGTIEAMATELHTMSLETDVPMSGWLHLRKKALLLLLENVDDDTVLHIPTSLDSLARRLDR